MEKLRRFVIRVVMCLFLPVNTVTCSGCPYVNGTIDLTSQLTTTSLDNTILNVCNAYYDAKTLILSNNSLTSISSDTFANFYDLKHLDLSNNLLDQLPTTVFHSLWNLETLDVSYNNLSFLQAGLLKNKFYLTSVNFERNNITDVQFMFVNDEHEHLVEVNLRYNSLEVFEPWPYQIYKNSDKSFDQNFYLEHNKIRTFTNTRNWNYDMVYPHNRNVYMMFNEIQNIGPALIGIYFDNVTDEDFFAAFLTLRMNITNNPYFCDCNLYRFAVSLRESLFKWTDVEEWRYRCAAPSDVYREDWLRLVPYEKLVCNITQDCPSQCFCQDRPYDGTTFVNCTGKQLSEMPDKLPVTQNKKLVLILDDNNIQELKTTHYTQDIFNLSLVGNNVQSLNPEIVKNMTGLEKLDLRMNQIKELPKEIQRLDYSKVILSGNPIRCQCDMQWISDWMGLSRQEADLDLTCTADDGGDSHRILNIDLGFLHCNNEHLIPLFVALGVILVLVVLIGIFAYRCPYETKVLLYKFICFHPGDKYEVDENAEKEYDVYFSYDHEDFDVRQWIITIVTKKLKKKFKSLKTFNPMINYEPGAEGNARHTEELTAMDKSKRIIIVLSAGSFVPDNRQECEILDSESMFSEKERSYGRIIYILYNNKAKEKLEKEVGKEPWKSRLSGKRVLTPDDRLFFAKLRYEMPQSKKSDSKRLDRVFEMKNDSRNRVFNKKGRIVNEMDKLGDIEEIV